MDINNDKILVSERTRSQTAKWVGRLTMRMMSRLIPSSLLVDCSFYNFRNAITACYFADRNFVVRKVNQTFRSLFPGNTKYEGRLLPSVLAEIGCPRETIQDFQDQLRGKGWVSIPEVTVSTNGETRYFSLFSTLTEFEGVSTLNGLQGQFIDRTDEVLLKIKLQQAYRELQDAQAELVQSAKMASLGQLVAGIAHEINNPLACIQSNIDTFDRGVGKLKTLTESGTGGNSPDRRDQLERVYHSMEQLTGVTKTAADRIQVIVRNLRHFARLDEAEFDQYDIHEGLDLTLSLLDYEITDQITVHKNYGELPLIICHPSQINQVFMHILKNACNAIEDSGDIDIVTSSDNESVVCTIRDSGRGIEKKNLRRLFDPGFTTKGTGVGTGLGLAIVHRIIEAHKGSIEVESEIGRGTNVRIQLPLHGLQSVPASS